MVGFQYDTYKTYLSTQWARLSRESCGLPWVSLLLLHLTISAYAPVILAGIRTPYRKDDLLQTPVLMALYHCSRIMQKRMVRALGWIAECLFYSTTLIVMVAASFYINVMIIFVFYLTAVVVGLGLRTAVLDWIDKRISERAYTALLYDIHLR